MTRRPSLRAATAGALAWGLGALPQLALAQQGSAAPAASGPKPAATLRSVALAGRIGERALLVVDGQLHTLAVGQAAGGLRFVRWEGESAEVAQGGSVSLLRMGATPSQVGATPLRQGGREIVISAGPGGHFTTAGSINGRPVMFLVDTGATLVSLSRQEAGRLGIDLANARQSMTHTANGPVAMQMVTLTSVRIGDVELTQVGAAVLPLPLPVVLLGNSFLARLQMRRDNDVMRLELR